MPRPKVTIRYRDGVTSRREARSKKLTLVSRSPDELTYAFDPESDLAAWAERNGCDKLLKAARKAIKQASPEKADREALVAYSEKTAKAVEKLRRNLGQEGTLDDPLALIREAERRGVLGTVALFSGGYYAPPSAFVAASIPNVSWVTGLPVQSIFSTRETAFLFDQFDYQPNPQRPRAVVWPGQGIPYLTFPVRSIFVYG